MATTIIGAGPARHLDARLGQRDGYAGLTDDEVRELLSYSRSLGKKP